MTTIATATLPKNVQYPQYDRSQLRSRIVHFGFGAFHRAHQALLTDRVLNNVGGDWGICEISLFSGDTLMSQLREQDHLFTVLEKGADGNQPIVIGAVKKATASIRRPGNWIRRIRALFTIWRIRRCRSRLPVF